MQKILTITLTDLRIFFSQQGNWIGIVILPIAFALVLGYSFSSESGPTRVRVDVLDEDQSALSAQFLTELRATDTTLVICPVDNDEEDYCRLGDATLDHALGIERARNDRTSGFLIIPAGYATAITQGTPLQIDYYSTDDPAFPGVVAQATQSVLEQVNSAIVAAQVGGNFLAAVQSLLMLDLGDASATAEQAIFDAAETRLQERPAPVYYHTTGGENGITIDGIQGGFGQSIPGMGSMYVMFTVLNGTAVLLRERRQWTLQRLAVMPITRAQLLGGKSLTYFTLGMIQYLIIFAVGAAVGLDFGGEWLGLLAVMVAFVLCMTALAFVLAIYMKNEEQAAGTARLLGLTLAPLGGAWWPLAIVPDFMQTIAKLSPVAWAMQGFQELIFYGGSLFTILPQVGVLLAAAALLFGLAIWNFQID